MAWMEKGSNGEVRLDFAHPRVVAAMKVTGIVESDLTGPPPPLRFVQSARLALPDKPGAGAEDTNGASTARARTLAASKDLWDRKQRQLLKDVEDIASHLDEANVEQILQPAAVDEDKLARVYNGHVATVDAMKSRNLAQLQREAGREIQKQSAQKEGNEKMEAFEKRLADEAAEKRAQLKADSDKRKEKLTKAQEKVKQAKKADWQKTKDFKEKQRACDDRLDKLIEEKQTALEQKKQESLEKRTAITERQMEHHDTEFEQKVLRYEEDKRRDRELEERLAMGRLEKRDEIEERRQKFAGKVEQAVEHQLQQDRDRRKNFLESAKKIDVARELAVATEQAKIAAVRARRDKELLKWTTNRQSLREQRKEEHFKKKRRNADIQVRAHENRDRYVEELVLTKSGNRGMLLDVVDQNRARIERSEEHAMSQALAKIERDASKKETGQLQREQVQAYRTEATKDFMLGRQKVEELRRIDPAKGDNSKRRVNDVLRDFNMPLLQERKPKEGEETEQK